MRPFMSAYLVLAAWAGAETISAVQVNNRLLTNESDGTHWASYGRTFSENHFSPLTEINSGNVHQLGLAWYYDLPPMASVLTAPLAVDGVLYFAVGYSIVHAMDAQTGELLWRYDPGAAEAAGHKLRGGWGIRGIAFWKDQIYTGTHDGRLIALNAKNGQLMWSVQTLNPDDSSYITGPPWVFNGKVAIGQGGADFGPLRGYVTAYDAETGEQAWRFYVVPGNPEDGFENEAMAMAAKTWKGEWWVHGGGGTVWNAMAYDPKFNRLYLGSGNGMPANRKIRSPGGGDNLFLASIIALDADTGEYVWHYQINPGETWDYNANMDIELADLTIDGQQRSVILHAPKNGFFYVIDRESGKLISAEPFVEKVTWAEQIDLATGRPVEVPSARFPGGERALVFPGSVGAHSVQAMSFNPRTGLAYIPAIESGEVYVDPDGDLSAWRAAPGMQVNQGFGVAKKRPFEVPPPSSSLLAWDPVRQQKAWSVPLSGMFNGGTATTAGNLVFQGRATGSFNAYAADDGEILWEFDAQTGVQSQPITYMAGDRQQVTVVAGWRGMGGSSGANPEWEYRLQPRRVLTFVLDGKANLPPPGPRTTGFIIDPEFEVNLEKAAIGQSLTLTHCARCHGVALISGGTAPDLRKSAVALSLDNLSAVLHEGLLVSRGMPRFTEFDAEQIEGIQHYILQQARVAAKAE